MELQRNKLVERAQKEAEEFAAELGSGALSPCYDFVEFKREDSKTEDQLEGKSENKEEAGQGSEEGEDKSEDKSEDKEEEPAAGEDETSTIVFIKSVPPRLKRAQLEEFLSPASLKFSEPVASKDWVRMAWANYDTPDACKQAYEKCKDATLEGVSLELVITPKNRMRNGPARPKILNRSFADERRIGSDLVQARLLMQHLDLEKGLVPNESLSSDQASTPSENLDLVVLYLKRVHLFDYYAGEEFQDMSDLERRSPAGWLRGKAPDKETENRTITKQEAILDQKIKQRLDHKWALDDRSLGDKLEQFQKKFLDDNTIKVEDGKFGCTFSNKLFMGSEFVHKHITNKHAAKLQEALDAHLQKLFFQNYCRDPSRPRTAQPMGYGKGKGGKGDFGWGKGGSKGKYGNDRFRGRSPPFRGRSPPRHFDRRRSSPPRRESFGKGGTPGRSIRSYQDLDDTHADVAPIDFDELDALEAMLGSDEPEKE